MRNDFGLLEKLLRKAESLVKKSLNRSNIPKQVGEEAREIVKERTRRGFGVTKNEGKKQRLKKLEPSTRNIRKSVKKLGKLSSETSVNKSNFTRTGQTLDNMKVMPSKSKVRVEVDSHGKQAIKTTEKISTKFNFVALSKSEVKVIKKSIEAELQKALKKFL